MRRLIKYTVVLAVLWCAWWGIASYTASTKAEEFFAAKADEGWQANISQSGFPLFIQTKLEDLRMADTASQTVVTMDEVNVSAPAYWPGYVTATLPVTPVTFATPVGDYVFEGVDTQADVRLAPGTALTLQDARVASGAWLVRIGDEVVVEAQNLDLTTVQNDLEDTRYNIAFEAEDLTPGTMVREMISLPGDWPETFEAMKADASVAFDKPLDRFANEGTPPRPRAIDLRSLDVTWGAVALTANGTVQITSEGRPDGNITVQLTQFPQLLSVLESGGVLDGSRRRQVELMLRAFGNGAGDPGDLQLTLTFANGRMALGPIDLGPAPQVYLQ